jgi:WD40 repeat protein
MMAGVGWSTILRLWDPLAGRLVFSTHASWNRLRFSADDRFLAAWQHDNTLRIWEVNAGSEYRTLTANPAARGEREFESLAISPDGGLLAAGTQGGLGIWDCASGELLAFVENSSGNNHVLWEPSGALLAMGEDGLFRRTIRRQAETGVLQIGTPERLPLPGVPLAIAQSRDGRVLASAQFAGAVVLHMERPDRLVPLGPQADVRRIAVSPDGHWVVTGGFGGRGGAKVWDARTGKAEKDLFMGDGCYPVFSPDGKRLVTGAGMTRQIRLWEVGTWAEIPFKEPVKGTFPVFSPDGKLLVVESGAGVARLLDPESGREFARLEDPNQDRANGYSFSKDGTKLVIASSDGRCLHIWDLRALRETLADMGLDWNLIKETRAALENSLIR